MGGQYKIGYTPSKALLAETEGFVTPAELAESGAITSSFEEKNLLASLDSIYIKFHGVQAHAGEQYVVFRPIKEVYHPVTGDLDRLPHRDPWHGESRLRGAAAGHGADRQAFDTIERGDLGRPLGRAVPPQRAPQGERAFHERLHHRVVHPGDFEPRPAPRGLHRPRPARRGAGGQRVRGARAQGRHRRRAEDRWTPGCRPRSSPT